MKPENEHGQGHSSGWQSHSPSLPVPLREILGHGQGAFSPELCTLPKAGASLWTRVLEVQNLNDSWVLNACVDLKSQVLSTPFPVIHAHAHPGSADSRGRGLGLSLELGLGRCPLRMRLQQ